jgi:hypothetical protein
MARKSFAQRRLDNIRQNKRRLKEALSRLPQAPPALGLRGREAFQQELLLNRVVELENNLMNAGVPIPPPSIPRALMTTADETLTAGEALLETLSDDDFADTPLIDAVLEDVQTGRDVIRASGQFDLQNLLPRFSDQKKRTRRKTKTDKNMSKALRLANERFRKKNGSLRKGATQTKIMKYAHKLLKKM